MLTSEKHGKRSFPDELFAQNQADKILVVQVAGTLVLVQFRYLETALAQFADIERQAITLTVEDLGRRAGLADKDERNCSVKYVLHTSIDVHTFTTPSALSKDMSMTGSLANGCDHQQGVHHCL